MFNSSPQSWTGTEAFELQPKKSGNLPVQWTESLPFFLSQTLVMKIQKFSFVKEHKMWIFQNKLIHYSMYGMCYNNMNQNLNIIVIKI